MVSSTTLIGTSAAAAAGAGLLERRYRRDLRRAEKRLASLDRSVTTSRFGSIEYAVAGTGEPVLVSHGIFHGFDGGLLSTDELVDSVRIIAPSRFGYLGSTMPPGATVADQADAFAFLLDHLGHATVDILGISAGTGAAVQFALRHPERVNHLIVSSGSFPGSPTAAAPPEWARWLYSDRAMWTVRFLAPSMFARIMGVPKGFPAGDEDVREIERMTESIFPIGPRVDGAVFDAYVSNPEIVEYPLEQIEVPTLIIHASDDPLASYDAAAAAAERIPGSTLITLESGGHLQLGYAELARTEMLSFLRRPTRISSG